MAISLQSRDTLTPAHFEILRLAVTKMRIGREDITPFVASYAAMAIGRIGDKDKDVHALRRVVASSRTKANVLRSAVIALGKLGKRCDAGTRMAIAKEIRDGVRTRRIDDITARSFALISLAYLVESDIAAGQTGVLSDQKIGEFLLRRTDKGQLGERSYAALALGLVCRAIGEETTVTLYGNYQSDARTAPA